MLVEALLCAGRGVVAPGRPAAAETQAVFSLALQEAGPLPQEGRIVFQGHALCLTVDVARGPLWRAPGTECGSRNVTPRATVQLSCFCSKFPETAQGQTD